VIFRIAGACCIEKMSPTHTNIFSRKCGVFMLHTGAPAAGLFDGEGGGGAQGAAVGGETFYHYAEVVSFPTRIILISVDNTWPADNFPHKTL
jgi:hypothetical protein